MDLLGIVGFLGALTAAQGLQPAEQPGQGATQANQNAARCRIEGQVKSGNTVLPGASIVVSIGGAVKAATSTDAGGRYFLAFTPNATYHLSTGLTNFAPVDRDITFTAPPCN